MNGRRSPQSVEELTRELLEVAYPEKDSAWIDAQVALTGQRVSRAKLAEPSTAAGARQLPDAVINRAAPDRRRGPRVAIRIELALIGQFYNNHRPHQGITTLLQRDAMGRPSPEDGHNCHGTSRSSWDGSLIMNVICGTGFARPVSIAAR